MQLAANLRRLGRFFRSPKRLLTISIIILMVAAIAVIIPELTAPVHGQLVAHPTDVQLTKPKTTALSASSSLASNSFISLTLPSGFVQQANSSLPAGLRYSATVLKQSMDGSQIIAIAIKSLPPGGLAGDSSYELRVSQPANYHASNLTIDGEPVVLMSDLTADGTVAFWVHQNYEATISITTGLGDGGGGEQPAEQATLTQLLGGWQWL